MLMGKSEHFDYQIGVGNFFSTGSYSATSSLNRRAGYWEIFYTVEGCYYPSGDRKGFAISTVARIAPWSVTRPMRSVSICSGRASD